MLITLPATITLDVSGHLSPSADPHIPFLLKSECSNKNRVYLGNKSLPT